MKERLFTWTEHWGDSAGYYAVMPVRYNDQDCYILLESSGSFGIYDNQAETECMPEDMYLTGNIHDTDLDYEIVVWLKMLDVLIDAWK